jgi:hypothetical protein
MEAHLDHVEDAVGDGPALDQRGGDLADVDAHGSVVPGAGNDQVQIRHHALRIGAIVVTPDADPVLPAGVADRKNSHDALPQNRQSSRNQED